MRRDLVMAKNIPKRKAFRAEKVAGEKSARGCGMGITQYYNKTWSDLLSSLFFHFLTR